MRVIPRGRRVQRHARTELVIIRHSGERGEANVVTEMPRGVAQVVRIPVFDAIVIALQQEQLPAEGFVFILLLSRAFFQSKKSFLNEGKETDVTPPLT